LKGFANAHSISENDLKHEIPPAKNLRRKEWQLPTSLEQFLSFKAPCKATFDCSYKLLLIDVTLSVTSASCEGSFPNINTYSENIFQKFHEE